MNLYFDIFQNRNINSEICYHLNIVCPHQFVFQIIFSFISFCSIHLFMSFPDSHESGRFCHGFSDPILIFKVAPNVTVSSQKSHHGRNLCRIRSLAIMITAESIQCIRLNGFRPLKKWRLMFELRLQA